MIAGLFLVVSLMGCYLPPVETPVSVPYTAPACTYCAGHRGVEYALDDGSGVRAVAEGVVTFAGVVAGTRYLVVLQADGLRATYGMLQGVLVTRGDVVVAGQLVGRSGLRLYFGLRDVAGEPVDPTALFGQLVGRPRLLPADGRAQRRPPIPRMVCTARVSGVLPA